MTTRSSTNSAARSRRRPISWIHDRGFSAGSTENWRRPPRVGVKAVGRGSALARSWALAVAVALAIGAVALVLLHHRSNANPTPANPVAVGTVSIAAQAPDPTGGLPWGLRTIQTGRLQACLQIGRLQSGQIGALGQDGAFDNDGRFHPIPLANNFGCGRTDAHGYLFLNVFAVQIPASAALGASSCCRPTQPPARLLAQLPKSLRRYPSCPARDLRNVAFGVLGPEAVSVSYSVNHHSLTERTGPVGA